MERTLSNRSIKEIGSELEESMSSHELSKSNKSSEHKIKPVQEQEIEASSVSDRGDKTKKSCLTSNENTLSLKRTGKQMRERTKDSQSSIYTEVFDMESP